MTMDFKDQIKQLGERVAKLKDQSCQAARSSNNNIKKVDVRSFLNENTQL